MTIVDVATVSCDLPRSGLTQPHHVARTWIGLPLSGVFRIHARGDEHLVHAAVGVVFPAGIEYRMTHPVDGGDTDVALMFRADVTEEALPARLDRVRVTRLDLAARRTLGMLLAALRRADGAAVEEISLDLLARIAAGLAPTAATDPGSAARRTIDRVRLLLAERPELPWTTGSIARLVRYSPFHLARQFRACTGTTMHGYLRDLRLAEALRRIEAGEASLATVAADLGFSHHSHMTATLRRRLGVTPRAIREQQARGA